MTINWRRNTQNCSLLTAQLYLAVEMVSWSKIYLFKDRGCFLTFQGMVCFSMARWKLFTRLSTVDKRFYFQQLVCWYSPPPAPPAILAGNGHVLNGRSYLVSARRTFLARILKLHCACAVMKPPQAHVSIYTSTFSIQLWNFGNRKNVVTYWTICAYASISWQANLARTMTTLRPFSCEDLFRFNNINLDPLTETYNLAFYLMYMSR